MSTTTLLSTSEGRTLGAQPARSIGTTRPATASGYGFPTTTDFSKSPFKDISVGHSRIVLPTFASLEEEEQYRKEHLAAVFRVLAREGNHEGINGHCSVRSVIDPTKFYINPYTKSFYRMRASDLVLVNGDGTVVQDGTATQQRSVDASATGLHAPIYRMAKDVQSLVHVHGAYSKAFSSLGKPVEMINQDACAFYKSIIDIPFQGVIVDESEGGVVVNKITADTKIAMLQNHGTLALGRYSADEAAYWWIMFEKVCHAQLLVMSALKEGEKPIMVSDEARDFTYKEAGYPEMGWLGFAAYYEREEYESGGEFKN